MALNYLAAPNSLGYGTVARQLLAALDAAGAEPALFPLAPVEPGLPEQAVIDRAVARAARFDHKAPCLRVWHQFEMAHRVGSGRFGGYSFFELDRLTEREVHHLNGLDVAFAPSKWAERVMRDSGVTTAVSLARPGVDTSVFHPGVKPHPVKKPTPNTTVFLNVGKWSVLKGHDFLLDVFNAAFTPADDVLLLMVCFHPLQVPGFDGPAESKRWEEMYLASPMGRAGRIRVAPGRLPTQRDVAALMAAADCGVFLARGEGWNLELAEMLAMGKRCVHTDWSAHREFADFGGSWGVGVADAEEAYDPPFIQPGVGCWAHLGHDQKEVAVSHLRKAHEWKRTGTLPANDAGVRLFGELFTWANCAREMTTVLGV
jgi:glycosyltransferase involved in cell wall biosynthesis